MITIPGKIPITIHPLFWLLALFIGWMSSFSLGGTLLAVVVIVISVLCHEFGHALTAVAFGQKTRIELAVFGGFTYRQGRKLKLWEEFLVVLNGPLSGLIIAAIAFLLLHYAHVQLPPLVFMLKFAFLVNVFWTIVNLVPVLPLDGGHLLSILLESIFGFRGVKMAIVIGVLVSVAITVFFFVKGYFLAGALFLILTFESFRALRYYRLLTDKDRDTDLQELMRVAEEKKQAGDETGAIAKYEEIRKKAKEGILYTVATQSIAETYKKNGKYKEAYELLLPIKNSLTNESLPLLHFLAYKAHDYKTIKDLANQTYQISPSPETALINAMAYGVSGDAEASCGWLECAIRDGLPSASEALKKQEFDSIRNNERFQELVKSV